MKKTGPLLMLILVTMTSIRSDCKKTSGTDNPPPPPPPPLNGPVVDYWFTKGDRSMLLTKQTTALQFGDVTNNFPVIDVDSTVTFQTVEGFGYTLTGGSAQVINRMTAADRANLLQELFGSAETSIKISYLRLSMGASDLNAEVYSYNDLPAGQTDVNLNQFSIFKDTVDVIPVLKQILAINPNIKLLATPWSAPVWMKTNNSTIGGGLNPTYYSVYAKYFVKYVQAMAARGININAIAPQNEPENPNNNPSMTMTAPQQTDFIKNHLGPAFQTAGITTKIIIFDHNCDNPNYPISIMNDPVAKQYVAGSAFHLYAGNISALSTVRSAHPDKDIYFTEQWTSSAGMFKDDLRWHLRNVIVGSLRNWSKVTLEWNLANDGGFRPFTPGGCSQCMGAITLDGTVVRNVAYYIIGHVSRFVPPGSVRIQSTFPGDYHTVAFLRPDGKKVLIVLNDGNVATNFSIVYKGKKAVTSLEAGAVATYVWQ
jgi:glucosylceramidase